MLAHLVQATSLQHLYMCRSGCEWSLLAFGWWLRWCPERRVRWQACTVFS